MVLPGSSPSGPPETSLFWNESALYRQSLRSRPAGNRKGLRIAVDTEHALNDHSFMSSAGVRRPRAAPRLDRRDKRDAILRAAIDTFAASGFFNAQVADIARGA